MPGKPNIEKTKNELSNPVELDYIIVGQGISGTWLSYYLKKEEKRFMVFDNASATASSRIAAGIINPVTGRRHVTVWMAEEILPFAFRAYSALGHELEIPTILQKNILEFFPGPQMRESFLQRVEEKSQYVHSFPEQNKFNEFFRYDFGCGEIRPVYTVQLDLLLPAWRRQLIASDQLREEDFDINDLIVENDQVRYRGFTAQKIIFCDGTGSSINKWFKPLPFAPNKGEALLLNIPGLPEHHIYKKGMMLVPMSEPGQWWAGSSYEWDFEHPDPTDSFREKTEALLKHWLKIPFTITDHLAGVRPATIERRPFVGLHPVHSAIGMLNGMGTKGCSLAPFFARQLADQLVFNLPISPEADIARFGRMLSRELS